MWTNGSRSARSTPAKARRTGNPSPSKARGAVVTERTGRGRASAPGAGIFGRESGSAVTAGTMASRSLREQALQPPRRLLGAQALVGSGALGHGVEAHELAVAKRLAFRRRSSAQRPLESLVGLQGPLVAQRLGDRDERLAAHPELEGLVVARRRL